MARYCLGYLCYDGSRSVIALAGNIYNNYDDAENKRKEVQPKYKHLIEVFEI